MRKNDSFTYFNLLILHMLLHVINKVKVTHQSEGHIKVKVKYLHPFKFYVVSTLCKRVVCIRLKGYLFVQVMTQRNNRHLSISVYISVLAIMDSISLMWGKYKIKVQKYRIK